MNKVKTVIDCSTKEITTVPLTDDERNEFLKEEEEKNITKAPTAQERIDALEEALLLLMMEV